MTFYPVALQFLPLAGGVLTGPLTTAGITNVGAFANSAGAVTQAGNLSTSALGVITASGGFDANTAGTGFKASEAANGKQGRATLVAGTVTVANTSVTASSEVLATGQVAGGTPGGVNVSARTAGTSFTLTSTNAADTSTVGFEIFEPG